MTKDSTNASLDLECYNFDSSELSSDGSDYFTCNESIGNAKDDSGLQLQLLFSCLFYSICSEFSFSGRWQELRFFDKFFEP